MNIRGLIIFLFNFDILSVNGDYTNDHIQRHETFRFTANHLNRARFYQLRRMPLQGVKTIPYKPHKGTFKKRKDGKRPKQIRINLIDKHPHPSPPIFDIQEAFRDSLTSISSGGFINSEPPTIICGSEKIGLSVSHGFKGRIYASHRELDPRCVHTITGTNAPLFTTPFDGPCGVRRVWNASPSNAIQYHLRVIVSYGFEQLTEEDKIFDLTCSYSLQNVTLEAFYDMVNFIPKAVNGSSLGIPKCRYSLHKNRLDGPKTANARIGDVIYHRWQCPPAEYRFKVYHCAVHNGHEKSYMIVDDRGCSLDEEVIPHPEYDVENGIVYTPAKAFR
ncbi:hypothetical protein WR25_19877 [Diploscapter pachys]|uniref:ZP domain-containing protein n=1 Tax=Diploscapter pachys TaxID=2018661 RepID=A0A2A2LBR0_9BILA|nr:hypothetical protein WR25_19877 [Diploscapter pachys]